MSLFRLARLAGPAVCSAVNPAFPTIRIGQYSPLVGNRPFRRPANSGSLLFLYADHKARAFNATVAAVSGFPALPRTVRAGVTIRGGGH